MSNHKINWGIIGAGRISNTVAHDMQLVPNTNLHAIASRDTDRAQKFAERHGVTKYYDSYEALASDPLIDVVYIATPHPKHIENTLLCLKNGKHVLCEKPMGMDSSQVNRMISMAKSQGLFLMEALWTRFIPATEKLLELLNAGNIGKILTVHADFGFKSAFNPESRLFNKALGGGALMDIGIYPIYLALLLLGKPKTIKAVARMTETQVDSYCAMLFDYDHSAQAMLEATFESDTPVEAIIYGEEGIIKMHRRWHHTTKISVDKAGESTVEHEMPYTGHGYTFEIEEVNRCIQNKLSESTKMPHAMSLELIDTIDRVKQEIGMEYDL